ncbi:MAG: hypothetical protein EBZ47_00780 [Chlamydiae bacterium]|nr:hypothetical protein [Chlamydiota bacterium]
MLRRICSSSSQTSCESPGLPSPSTTSPMSLAEAALEQATSAGAMISDFFRPADFTKSLKNVASIHIFKDTPFDRPNFDTSLQLFRQAVSKDPRISPDLQEIAYKLFTQPGLPQARNELSSRLALTAKQTGFSSFTELFQADRQALLQRGKTYGQGSFDRAGKKLSGHFGIGFDPVLFGNLPYQVGTRHLSSGTDLMILRHPVPTVEALNTKVEISPEYLAFLSHCQAHGKKVLYISHLKPDGQEQARINKLHELGANSKGVLHFVKMPLDKPFDRLDNYADVYEYKFAIQEDILTAIEYPTTHRKGFIFGSRTLGNKVEEKYNLLLDLALDMVTDVYSRDNLLNASPLNTESKQAFYMLFCLFLRSFLIQSLDISFVNNTCKDAIDRGAAFLMSDLLWEAFIHNTLLEEMDTLRLHASWPAYMAKTQAVLEDRAVWIDSLASFLLKAEAKGLREKFAESCHKILSGHFHEKTRFFDPKISTFRYSVKLSSPLTIKNDELLHGQLFEIISQFKQKLSSDRYWHLQETDITYTLDIQELEDHYKIQLSNVVYQYTESFELVSMDGSLESPQNPIYCSLSWNYPKETSQEWVKNPEITLDYQIVDPPLVTQEEK